MKLIKENNVTVLSYLNDYANEAIIRDSEKDSIKTSIDSINGKFEKSFDFQIKEKIIFGSYSRETILPRRMDENSDIDYMIVFKERNLAPQTYLNKSREFVNTYYSSSEIKQSHPTIQLHLNHITFELVPAIQDLYSGYKIPSKMNGYDNWIPTDPDSFSRTLLAKNSQHAYLVKPLIRIVKYWNAQNGYIFESYWLEQKIVEYPFYMVDIFGPKNLQKYFFAFMKSLTKCSLNTQIKLTKIERVINSIENIEQFEREGNLVSAKREIIKIFDDDKLITALARSMAGSR